MLDLYWLCRDMSNPKSPLRREADWWVGQIASCLDRPSPATAALLAGWREDFRMIYGEISFSAHKRLDRSALLAAYGLEPGTPEEREERMQHLVLAIQTYFSLLIKTIMASMLGESIRDRAAIIRGDFALRRGIVNYCADDWYRWPEHELDNGMDRVLDVVAEQAARYALPGAGGGPVQGRDDMKRLYEALIPPSLRHALGEYYTPDWLAAYTLGRGLTYSGRDIGTLKIADPSCGSGTFLLQAIAGKRRAGCGLREILSTVRGLDINPLAVLSAKSNCLLAVLDLLELGEEAVDLPVYQTDALTLEADGERAELVAGNPPWVNWEYLPPAYRAGSQELWSRYGLVSAKGPALSFLKEDVSVLMTCAAADRLLAGGGDAGSGAPSGAVQVLPERSGLPAVPAAGRNRAEGSRRGGFVRTEGVSGRSGGRSGFFCPERRNHRIPRTLEAVGKARPGARRSLRRPSRCHGACDRPGAASLSSLAGGSVVALADRAGGGTAGAEADAGKQSLPGQNRRVHWRCQRGILDVRPRSWKGAGPYLQHTGQGQAENRSGGDGS